MNDTNHHFKTVEISDPELSQDGINWTTVNTPNLPGRGDVCFFANTPPTKDTPIIILLHGVFGSAWSWAYSGAAHKALIKTTEIKKLPSFIIAMPSDGLLGHGSGYLNTEAGKFENWIIEDVPTLAGLVYPQLSNAPRIYLSGLSMGGYGALRLGMKHCDKVSGISAHSSITKMNDFEKFLDAIPPHLNQVTRSEHDLIGWVERHCSSLPPLRFDCGVNDELIEANRAFRDFLVETNVMHTYQEFSGGHEWSYWSQHISKTFEFFGQIEDGLVAK